MPVIENESQRRSDRRGHGARARAGRARRARRFRDDRPVSDARARACPCALFARATERAALAGARWLGRADQDAAEEAAEVAMLAGLDRAADRRPRRDRRRRRRRARRSGSDVGAGGEAFDLALDPLEGRGVVARGGNGAMSMIAVGPRGSLLPLPDMYMRQMAVGPRARGQIDLARPVAENIARSPTRSAAT